MFLVNSRSASFVVSSYALHSVTSFGGQVPALCGWMTRPPKLFVRNKKRRRRALSLSYGRCIAEFLNEGSLIRLGLLDLSTCVGFRYG